MLPRIASEAARRFGDATAYVAPGGWDLTYTDVDRISDHVAAGFAQRGLRPGDVLALVLPPGPEYLVAYLAAAKLGAITAGVNDRLASAERDAILEIAAPRLVLAAPGLAPSDPALAVEDATPAEAASGVLRRLHGDDAPPLLPENPARPVAIIFTSGTTGLPKGALYTNRQLEFITATDVGGTWGGGTRSFTGTSFAHLGFMTKLPGNLMRGGTSFIMTKWRARAALELLARERMSTVAGVPTQLALMLADPEFDRFDLTSVRAIIVGGGPITPATAVEARDRFGAVLATRYSCTEAGIGLGTAFDDPLEDAIVSVGRPHPAVDLALVDEDDRLVEPGAVGQVCLRSSAVMQEYWNNPEGTRAAFTRSGHVRTGDLGWIDDAGRLRLVGRSKEMYVRGGYNVYPVEVEAVLTDHPAIEALAIVPASDPVMGEVGVAVMVARRPGRPPSLDELRSFAAERLARYKLPEATLAVDALPLTAGDKIDRSALRSMVET
ncbi:MAG: acyl--CoA ligase, partial [Acidimicrobiia bacterium]|nr:acyl--CoA ligase [Acidimicrobiia bacterium]